MITNQYIKIFILRFLGYFVFFAGMIATLFQFGPVISAEVSYRKDQIFNVQRSVVSADEAKELNKEGKSGFGAISGGAVNRIIPISTDYGIIIEKINANAKIVANVNPAIESEYVKALQLGVAEAKGSTAPGQPGNLFLFSHSTDAPWNVARYNAIFYLLKELQIGDKVVIFYQGRRYDYQVYDKTITSPADVHYLTNRYDKPVLTLQTCDPPGTSLNRLIIRASLVGS
jgi:LPXTG-site transpeptidase (sortase) family protein